MLSLRWGGGWNGEADLSLGGVFGVGNWMATDREV